MQLIFKRPVDKNCVMENFSLSFPVFFLCLFLSASLCSLPLLHMHMHPQPTHMPRDSSPTLKNEFIFMNFKLMQKEEARV